MKTFQKVTLALLLTFFLCSTSSLNITPAPLTSVTFADSTAINESQLRPPSPEPPHKLVPLSILVYTEYVDSSPGGEYEHTIGAINDTYGTDYYTTNLTDYNDLGTLLPGHDIFLIPEQENVVDDATMRTVGQAWASILPGFVNNGGIVILMSFGSFWALGTTSYIYNESGLIDIYGFTDVTFTTIYRVNSSDALARGVSASWGAPNGALSFDTGEQTVVVDDGTDPVVIHKTSGKGHVVLLGFDLFNRETNCDTILGNAIRLHRHVVFDDSHNQLHDILGSYSSYADDLVTAGFAVSSMGIFNPGYFTAADVLVIPACDIAYSNAEINQIEFFVYQGGGLFLLGDWSTWGDEIATIAQRFGYNFNGTVLYDADENSGDPGQPDYNAPNILNHSLTLNVAGLEFYYGTGFNETPINAVPIIITDTDGSGTWMGGIPARGVTCVAASTFGSGRVVISGDSDFLGDQDWDTDATPDYNEFNNAELGINTIRWLSAAGLKERVVLFEQSHSPNYTVGLSFLGLARILTENGFTIHWMTTFYTTLLDIAHILVLVDGSIDYTAGEITAIKNFVTDGGSLLLLAAYDQWGAQADAIGNEFGIDRNDTAYLEDSDDFLSTPAVIAYTGANIGTHEITQGITRIEMSYTSAFDTIGSATPLIISDNDGTCTWSDGGVANDVPITVALEHGFGRLVYSAGYIFLRYNYDSDGDGIYNLYEKDNMLFAVNIFQWLGENRAPSVTVDTPNGGEILEGASNTISWTAIDPNKDAMHFDVLYSANGGGSWTPLVIGMTSTSVNFDVTGLPEGNQYLIRVIAFDYDASTPDESDAVFSVETEGPIITNIQHTPPTPTSGAPILISADVTDVSGLLSVVCHYSIDGGGTWMDVPMALSAGDTYEAAIGPFLSGVTVEYQIIATDNSAAGRTTASTSTSFLVTAFIPPLPPWLPLLIAAIIIIVIVLILVFFLRRRPKEVEA